MKSRQHNPFSQLYFGGFYILFYVYEYLPACILVRYMCTQPVEAKGEHTLDPLDLEF